MEKSKADFLVSFGERKRVVRSEPRHLAEACGVAFNLLSRFRLELWSDQWSSWIEFDCTSTSLPRQPKVRIMGEDTSETFLILDEPVSHAHDAEPPMGRSGDASSVGNVARRATQGPVTIDASGGPDHDTRAAVTSERSTRDWSTCSTVSVASTPILEQPSVGESPVKRPAKNVDGNAESPTECSGAARPVASTPILEQPSVGESPAERPAKNVDGSVLDLNLLPCTTRERLLAGRHLGFSELRDVYQGVYDTFRQQNKHSYPANYRDVTHKLLRSFPMIQQSLHLSEAATMETVLTKLRTKFRNERKKRPASPGSAPVPKKAKTPGALTVDGLPNFSFGCLNESPIEVEKKLNKLRFEGAKMSEEERQGLLVDTLPNRRHAILGNGKKLITMSKLKTLFPFIFGETELWREMALLAGEPVKEKYAEKLGAALDRLSDECGCPRELAAETMLRLLAEENALVGDSAKNGRGPKIVHQDSDYAVLIESTEVATCASLEDACMCVANAVYVFNQAVPNSLKGFMWLMATGVMGLPTERKPSAEALLLAKMFKQ